MKTRFCFRVLLVLLTAASSLCAEEDVKKPWWKRLFSRQDPPAAEAHSDLAALPPSAVVQPGPIFVPYSSVELGGTTTKGGVVPPGAPPAPPSIVIPNSSNGSGWWSNCTSAKQPRGSVQPGDSSGYCPMPALAPTQIAKKLDDVEKYLGEWGHASASDFFLIPDSPEENDTGFFRNDYPHSYATIDANVRKSSQGSASLFIQQASGFSGEAKLPAEASSADKTQINLLLPSMAKEGTNTFSNFGNLLPNPAGGPTGDGTASKLPFDGDLTLSETDVAKIAKDALMAGKMLDMMSDPRRYARNTYVFTALTQVAVTPGWRTKFSYACEVQVRPRYLTGPDSDDGATCDQGHRDQPTVFAAFPLAEARVIDMAFGERRQFQLILQLAAQFLAAGKTASANAIYNYIKRVERDVATRTPLPTIIPSSDGTEITYRFEPALQAQGNPSQRGTSPQMVLNPTAIPALVILVCHKSELKNYTHLGIETTARWLPSEKRHLGKKIFWDWLRYGRMLDTREKLDQRTQIAGIMGDAQNALCSFSREKSWELSHLRDRFNTLAPLFGGRRLISEIPAMKPAIFASTDGTHLQRGTIVNLKGEGFKRQIIRKYGNALCPENEDVVRSVTIDGVIVPHVINSHQELQLKIPAGSGDWLKGTSAKVHVSTLGGDLEVVMPVTYKDPPAPPSPALVSVVPKILPPALAPGRLFTFVLKDVQAAKDGLQAYIGSEKLTGDPILSGNDGTVTMKLPETAKLAEGVYHAVLITGGQVLTLENAVTLGAGAKQPETITPEISSIAPPSGYLKGSSVFTISGAGFLDKSGNPKVEYVLVGARKATELQVLSDNRLVITVPARDKETLPTTPTAIREDVLVYLKGEKAPLQYAGENKGIEFKP